jgi:translation initiation factor 1
MAGIGRPRFGGSTMGRKREKNGVVWSSRHGRMCPGCGNPAADCACADGDAPPVGDGVARVRRETKGRKGRGVTVVTGVPLPPGELKGLAKRLKQRLSSGGTVKDGTIEIQGDHVERLRAELEAEGYRVK